MNADTVVFMFVYLFHPTLIKLGNKGAGGAVHHHFVCFSSSGLEVLSHNSQTSISALQCSRTQRGQMRLSSSRVYGQSAATVMKNKHKSFMEASQFQDMPIQPH